MYQKSNEWAQRTCEISAKICSNTLQSDKENKIMLVLTTGNHWLRICVCLLRKTYGNKIESKGVQFFRWGAPDKTNRGGYFTVTRDSLKFLP